MLGSSKLFTTCLILALATSACGSISSPEPTLPPDPTVTPIPQYKILFIGDNYIDQNQGLPHHTKLLAGSADPPLVIEVDAVTSPMYPLKGMWDWTNAPETISEGDFDVVVLQEDIPAARSVDSFNEYAPKFVAEIREVGAVPVLFMAWTDEEYDWITMVEIAQMHHDIATELDVDVAPVGIAFQRVMEERPELALFNPDGHLSIYGTYLATNMVFTTVFNMNPIGLAYLPSGYSDFSKEEAAYLQRIAWETTQEYQAQQ